MRANDLPLSNDLEARPDSSVGRALTYNVRGREFQSRSGRLFSRTFKNQTIDLSYYAGQSGFGDLHSVLTCLLKIINDWFLNMDADRYTSVICITVKKAFGTFHKIILLQKLNHHGIQGKEMKLLQPYLGNRK